MAKRKPHRTHPEKALGNQSPNSSGKGRGVGKGGGGAPWLYGHHAVLAALANPERHNLRLVMTAEARKTLSPRLEIIENLPSPEIAERAMIDTLLPPGAVHQGIALQSAPLESGHIGDMEALAANRENAVVVILDQVTDPHNVGAVLRSAAAFGALAVVTQDRHAPEESGTLAKAASGALESVPLIRVTNIVRCLEDLKEMGFWSAGLDARGDKTLAEARLSGKVALVLGAEGSGMRRLVAEHCDHLVRLPMTGAVESLNVSNAAAVALYELSGRGLS